MARPVHANAEATRKRILDAASLLFAERDQGGASFRHIAREAGVSIGTVHHYFGGKDALHQACIDAMYDDLAGLQAALWPALAVTDPEQVLSTAVHEAFAFARQHRQSLVLLMREVIRRGELDPVRRAENQRPFLEQAAAVLSERTGAEPARARLALQSAINLIVRYAIASDQDLLLFTGLSEQAGPKAVEHAVLRIEEQVVRLLIHELHTQASP